MKVKQLFLLMLVCLLSLMAIPANYVVKAANSGTLKVSILDDDGKTNAKGYYYIWATPLQVQRGVSSIANLAAYTNDWSRPSSPTAVAGGDIQLANLLEGRYLIGVKSIMAPDITVVQEIDLKFSKNGDVKTLKFTMTPDDESVDEKKTGAIGGNVNSQMWSRGAFTSATILARNKTMIWKAVSNPSSGAFQLYLPAGSYNVTLINNLNPSQRIYYDKLTVNKGITTIPLKGRFVEPPPSGNLNLALDELSFTADSLLYKGTVMPGTTVQAYSVSGNDYTLIGQTTAKASANSTSSVPFTLKLTTPQAGKMVGLVVEDEKFNRYAMLKAQLPLIDSFLTADTTKAEIGQAIDITFKDATKTYGTNAIIQMKRVNDTNYSVLSVFDKKQKTGDYTVTNGKITILPHVFLQARFVYTAGAGNYNIRIIQDGFIQKDIVQSLATSTVAAPSLSASINPGPVNDSLQIKATVAKPTNKIKYQFSVQPFDKTKMPKLYDLEPVGLIEYSYTTMPVLSGAAYYVFPYLRVYEIEEGRVAKFKEFPLNAKNTNTKVADLIPTLSYLVLPGSASGTTKVVMNASGTFKYMVGNSGSKPRPTYYDDAKGYQPLVSNEDIKAKQGQSIFIVQVNANNKIIAFAEQAVNLKP